MAAGHHVYPLNLLDVVLLFNAAPAGALSRLLLLKPKVIGVLALGRSPVVGFFEDRIGLDGFKLSLEARKATGAEGAAVGAATGIGEGVSVVLGFDASLAPERQVRTYAKDDADGEDLPVAFATAFFLGLLGIRVDVARLGEVAGEVLLWGGGAIGKAGVVTIVVFLGASH